MSPSPCPPRQVLDRLLDERLDAAERVRIFRHVAGCPACQRTLESLTTDPVIQAALQRLGRRRDGHPPK